MSTDRVTAPMPPMNASTVAGVLLGLLASAAWGFANIVISQTARAQGPVLPLLWGQAFGFVLLGLASLRWPATGPFEAWGWLLLAGVSCAVAYTGMFRAFAGGPVSVASPIIAGWAAVSALLGVVLFDESMPPLRLLGGALAVGGVVLIASRSGGPSNPGDWRASRSDVLLSAAASALGFGLAVTATRPLAESLGPILSIAAMWLVQWVFVVPYAASRPERRVWPGARALPLILLFGLLETVGFIAVTLGAQLSPLSVVSPAASLGSLFSVLLGRLLLGELVAPALYGWSIVVVSGVILLGISG